MPPISKIYWDACIFLAWLHEETVHGPGVLEGIEQTAKEVQNGQVVLFTSVLTKTEVLEYRLSKKAQEIFTNVFKRSNVSMVAQDVRVADLSHHIRNHYAQQTPKKMLSSTDCVHLATAILYKADVFYTLDGGGKRPRSGDLLPLDGNVAEHALAIKKPHAVQGSLLAGL